MNPELKKNLETSALIALLALITLCIVWEAIAAPLRPNGSWLVLKGFPLLLAVKGFAIGHKYTYKWMSLAIWIYFCEGCVRGWSDKGLSQQLALVEVALSLVIFGLILAMLRKPKIKS